MKKFAENSYKLFSHSSILLWVLKPRKRDFVFKKIFNVLDTVLATLIKGVIFFLVLEVFLYMIGVGSPALVHGKSMSHDGRKEYRVGFCLNRDEYEYGDIVIAFNSNSGEQVCKRIIGLPGDTVEVVDGIIYVNGIENNDFSYGKPTKKNLQPTYINSNYYFVCGDNRANSYDSRDYGQTKVKGKFYCLFTIKV